MKLFISVAIAVASVQCIKLAEQSNLKSNMTAKAKTNLVFDLPPIDESENLNAMPMFTQMADFEEKSLRIYQGI